MVQGGSGEEFLMGIPANVFLPAVYGEGNRCLISLMNEPEIDVLKVNWVSFLFLKASITITDA